MFKQAPLLILASIIMFSNSILALNPNDEIVASFPDITFAKGERIVGFELAVVTGSVIAIEGIPDDWSLNLQASQSSQMFVSGACVHGAGALPSSGKLPKFTVRIDKPFDETEPQFSINAKIHVTSDFEKSKEIKIGFEKMLISKKNI